MKNEKEIFKDAEAYLSDLFAAESSGHDKEHSLRVYRTAMTIARKREDVDSFLIGLASLLHDVDDIKLFPDHHQDENARAFMNKEEIPQDIQEKVCHIISQISFKGKDSVVPDSLEGQIVQDADRLDAIGAIGIARAFAFGGSRNRPLYIPNETYKTDMDEKTYRNNKGSTIAHFHEKLLLLKNMMNTKEAKEIAVHRDQVMRDFLKEFDAECKGEK